MVATEINWEEGGVPGGQGGPYVQFGFTCHTAYYVVLHKNKLWMNESKPCLENEDGVMS